MFSRLKEVMAGRRRPLLRCLVLSGCFSFSLAIAIGRERQSRESQYRESQSRASVGVVYFVGCCVASVCLAATVVAAASKPYALRRNGHQPVRGCRFQRLRGGLAVSYRDRRFGGGEGGDKSDPL